MNCFFDEKSKLQERFQESFYVLTSKPCLTSHIWKSKFRLQSFGSKALLSPNRVNGDKRGYWRGKKIQRSSYWKTLFLFLTSKPCLTSHIWKSKFMCHKTKTIFMFKKNNKNFFFMFKKNNKNYFYVQNIKIVFFLVIKSWYISYVHFWGLVWMACTILAYFVFGKLCEK